MRTKVRFFENTADIPDPKRSILEPAGCGPEVAEVTDDDIQGMRFAYLVVELYSDDPRLPILQGRFQALGLEPLERRWDEYTEEELDAARLLIMSYDNNETVFGGPRLGTTYDMSEACPRCGAGARQTSAMFIDGEDLPKLEGRRASATYYKDMLVDEKLAGTLAESGLTGISFRGVFAAFEEKGPIELPWRQICAAHTLPRMSPRSTGIEPYKPCACGRSSFTNPAEVPMRLAYRATDVADIRDVNVTWEWYGEVKFNGDVSKAVFPCPLFLVTPKVRRIFLDAGVTGFDWIPIRVEES
ncbi:hypothetical protein [Polyangium jinanense]|uniref:Uncharacterized protein n=1 Tax=Polyangium jinanense TaxID=2829994 RepID=A0A9X4AWE5_9BACT|nr:hypothetical protein [Polyangium jinanense]MDC3958782.1 hypothetical protein [Polyangium jinanense]MDC3985237.1 hypothetical protein [Polyangium jinanense]